MEKDKSNCVWRDWCFEYFGKFRNKMPCRIGEECDQYKELEDSDFS